MRLLFNLTPELTEDQHAALTRVENFTTGFVSAGLALFVCLALFGPVASALAGAVLVGLIMALKD